MATYQAGIRSGTPTATAPAAMMVAAASDRAYVSEIGVFQAGATATTVTLYRTLTVGATPTTTLVGQAQDPADAAATASIQAVWGTQPTWTAASKHRQIQLPTTAGAGVIWTFPKPLVVTSAATGGLLIVESGTFSVLDVYFVWDE